jgi:hypothetical protein
MTGATPSEGPGTIEPAPLDLTDHTDVVARIAAEAEAGTGELAALWSELVATYGEEAASRLWQEGLASSDVGQT